MLTITDCFVSRWWAWLFPPCSAPSGVKRAGSHRRPSMLQYPLGSVQAVDRNFQTVKRWLLNSGNWTGFWSFCLAQLHFPGRGWTNVSRLFNDWDVWRKTTYLYYGQLGSPFYLRESLCRREEELTQHCNPTACQAYILKLIDFFKQETLWVMTPATTWRFRVIQLDFDNIVPGSLLAYHTIAILS